jgi:hypothetical protein
MERPQCFVCGDDWGAHVFRCRLVAEGDPDAWLQMLICSRCWDAAERLHRGRLAAHERRLLAGWSPPKEITP